MRKIRKFKIPALNWSAEAWWEIIDWGQVQVVEPSILSRIGTDKLDQTVLNPITFPDFPCHSQSVERAVKLVPEAASKACGPDRRHIHIASVIASRKARKPFKSKKHYKYTNINE